VRHARLGMLKLASDADVHGGLIRGLQLANTPPDLVRVQDALPEGTLDPDVLEWAAGEKRILITHDRQTMVGYAYARVRNDQLMPGLIVVSDRQSVGAALGDIILIADSYTEDEMRDRVIFLPF